MKTFSMKLSTIIFLSYCLTANSQSVNKFYPDGYYFTNTVIKNNGWKFEWLSIMITPTKEFKKSVSVRLRNLKTDKWIDIPTENYHITRGSVNITFNHTHLGRLSFNGHFTQLQPPGDNLEIEAIETIVFVGICNLNQKKIPITFIWSERD
jgi:hypothetical protein